MCQVVAAAPANSDPGRRLHVLLVEDSPPAREHLAAMLVTHPAVATLSVAGTVAEARTRLNREQIDAVVLDIVLPDGSGLDVLHHMQAEHLTATTIVLTSHVTPELRQLCAALGVEVVLDKLSEHHRLVDALCLIPARAMLTERANDAGSKSAAAREANRLRTLELPRQALQQLLSMSDDGFVVEDEASRICSWSAGAERLLGFTAADARGRSFAQIARLDDASARLLGAGEESPSTLTLTLHHRDGAHVEARVSWDLLRDPAGNRLGTLIAIHDVSALKRLHAELARAQNISLAGELVCGLAHDLNNMLAPATLAIGSLREFVASPDALRLIRLAEAGTDRAAGAVRQILNLARGVRASSADVDTAKSIELMAETMRATFPSGIRVDASWAADLWRVRASVTELHQVLLNLCLNARDAMPHGGVVTLRATNVDLGARADASAAGVPGRYVEFLVADTGAGITPDQRKHIFEPFYTTKADSGGNGLGLSTARRILESRGGFIAFESEVGEGSQFRVYVPAVASACGAAP